MNTNEIKVYENGEYVKSVTLGDFMDVVQNAVKMQWFIITNGTEVEIYTGFRIITYKF